MDRLQEVIEHFIQNEDELNDNTALIEFFRRYLDEYYLNDIASELEGKLNELYLAASAEYILTDGKGTDGRGDVDFGKNN